MRLIHTADWHLGRIFHGVHLTDDQAHVLDELVRLAAESKVDAVLISGDVYDRAVPPTDAVNLLDEVLSRLVLDLKVPVILIAGNHDSPDRLGFASRLLTARGLHVIGSLAPSPMRITLEDLHGPVYFYAVPYAEPPLVRERLESGEICDHDGAMRALCNQIKNCHPAGVRSILLTHAFVAGGIESESERPLSVGGAGAVHPGAFDGFTYVALGHLHRAQSGGGNHVHYSGSILKYSFSEASHIKSVNLIEIGPGGVVSFEQIPLSPRRDVRCIEGSLKELMDGPRQGESREDYIMATITDREPILDAMGKLSSVYPNILHIDRTYLSATGHIRTTTGDHRKLGHLDLFKAFYSQVTGEELSSALTEAFTAIVDEFERSEREADA